MDKHLVGALPRRSMNAMKVVHEMLTLSNEHDEVGLILYDDSIEVEICLEESSIHREVKKLTIENLFRTVNHFYLSTSNNVFEVLCKTFRGQDRLLNRLFENQHVQRYIVFIASQNQSDEVEANLEELNELLQDKNVRFIGVCESNRINWLREMRKYKRGIGRYCKFFRV